VPGLFAGFVSADVDILRREEGNNLSKDVFEEFKSSLIADAEVGLAIGFMGTGELRVYGEHLLGV
jgi:hypothetical protein